MKFIFVRHGESEGNARKIRQGKRTDLHLTELGRQQARESADKLTDSDFDLILSSDLLRARETAEIISTRLNIPIVIIPSIHEVDLGELSGKTFDEMVALMKTTAEEQRLAEKEFRYSFRLWGGESAEDLLNRAKSFVEQAKADYPDKKLLVIGHAGFLRAMHHLYKKQEERPPLDNASIHEFDL